MINKDAVYGAIIGDMIGSVYEWSPTIKDHVNNFTLWFGNPLFHKDGIPNQGSRFTDDTVCGLAIADALCYLPSDAGDEEYKRAFVKSLKDLCPQYLWCGYGGNFETWMLSKNTEPYGSYGNGSAMRVFPIGLLNLLESYDPYTSEPALTAHRHLARLSAETTHNHEEGIKGAEATVSAMILARCGCGKNEIRSYIESEFGYDLHRSLDDIRPNYHFDVSCQGSVPESILCFIKGRNFEECIRLAVSLGGDADTMGCITGAIASCYYQIPIPMLLQCKSRLDKKLLDIAKNFQKLM